MFVNTAFVTPNPGKEEEILEIMHNFAKTLQGSQGLLRVHVLKEKDGKVLVGISMWESEGAFDLAMAAISSTPSSASKTRAMQETPTVVRKLVEV